MATEVANLPLLDWAVAGQALPGETTSGDLHLVQSFPNGALVAVVDGVGHGVEAAAAAQIAVATLQDHPQDSLHLLVRQCHERLRNTRGVAMSVASFNGLDATIAWAGVGNVEGVLLRAEASLDSATEYIVPQGGLVGLQLPLLRAVVIPVAAGDVLILGTDGLRSGFAEGLPLDAPPQQIAARILARDAKGTDDALVLVARYLGGVP